MDKTDVAIELLGITKTFGEVTANNNVDFSVKRGEILALLGENGSGKTTLMNMLSGIYKPDRGNIYINGKSVSILSPEDSKKLGIGMVHQHFKLVDIFSAADNIWIGAGTKKYGLKDKIKEIRRNKEAKGFVSSLCVAGKCTAVVFKSVWFRLKQIFLERSKNKSVQEFADKYGFCIDATKKVYDMSVSEKQTVEILKVLYYGADILILDEPTAVLTVQEIRKLFDVLRKMKQRGCAVVIITHKLNEVLEISDRVTILRKGECVGTMVTETTAKELTEMMVGRKIDLAIERPLFDDRGELLSIHNLTVEGHDKVKALSDISFTLHAGEILGVAGLSGSGQKELCESIAGLQSAKSGSIVYKGEDITGKTPRQIIDMGISMSFIPEDRLGMGLAASFDIIDNMMLKSYRKNKGVFVDRKSAKEQAVDVVERLEVVTPDVYTPVRKLSGGNVQKILLGREINGNPNLIITAYPVRGLDINSSYTVYDVLNEQKQNGVGVLFVGEDLDVMLELCDRIVVLCHGQITGIVEAKTSDKEELGILMTGGPGSAGGFSAEKREVTL